MQTTTFLVQFVVRWAQGVAFFVLGGSVVFSGSSVLFWGLLFLRRGASLVGGACFLNLRLEDQKWWPSNNQSQLGEL